MLKVPPRPRVENDRQSATRLGRTVVNLTPFAACLQTDRIFVKSGQVAALAFA